MEETCKPLSVESLSCYSWLVNSNKTTTEITEDCSSSFIEVDPRITMKGSCSPEFNFFNFSSTQLPCRALVHADQMFSNGFLLPLFSSEGGVNRSSSSGKGGPVLVVMDKRLRSSSLRRCRSFTKQVVHKYVEVFRPLLRWSLLRRCDGGVKNGKKNKKDGRRVVTAAAAAASRSSVGGGGGWGGGESDRCINEAIQYCKRSVSGVVGWEE